MASPSTGKMPNAQPQLVSAEPSGHTNGGPVQEANLPTHIGQSPEVPRSLNAANAELTTLLGITSQEATVEDLMRDSPTRTDEPGSPPLSDDGQYEVASNSNGLLIADGQPLQHSPSLDGQAEQRHSAPGENGSIEQIDRVHVRSPAGQVQQGDPASVENGAIEQTDHVDVQSLAGHVQEEESDPVENGQGTGEQVEQNVPSPAGQAQEEESARLENHDVSSSAGQSQSEQAAPDESAKAPGKEDHNILSPAGQVEDEDEDRNSVSSQIGTSEHIEDVNDPSPAEEAQGEESASVESEYGTSEHIEYADAPSPAVQSAQPGHASEGRPGAIFAALNVPGFLESINATADRTSIGGSGIVLSTPAGNLLGGRAQSSVNAGTSAQATNLRLPESTGASGSFRPPPRYSGGMPQGLIDAIVKKDKKSEDAQRAGLSSGAQAIDSVNRPSRPIPGQVQATPQTGTSRAPPSKGPPQLSRGHPQYPSQIGTLGATSVNASNGTSQPLPDQAECTAQSGISTGTSVDRCNQTSRHLSGRAGQPQYPTHLGTSRAPAVNPSHGPSQINGAQRQYPTQFRTSRAPFVNPSNAPSRFNEGQPQPQTPSGPRTSGPPPNAPRGPRNHNHHGRPEQPNPHQQRSYHENGTESKHPRKQRFSEDKTDPTNPKSRLYHESSNGPRAELRGRPGDFRTPPPMSLNGVNWLLAQSGIYIDRPSPLCEVPEIKALLERIKKDDADLDEEHERFTRTLSTQSWQERGNVPSGVGHLHGLPLLDFEDEERETEEIEGRLQLSVNDLNASEHRLRHGLQGSQGLRDHGLHGPPGLQAPWQSQNVQTRTGPSNSRQSPVQALEHTRNDLNNTRQQLLQHQYAHLRDTHQQWPNQNVSMGAGHLNAQFNGQFSHQNQDFDENEIQLATQRCIAEQAYRQQQLAQPHAGPSGTQPGWRNGGGAASSNTQVNAPTASGQSGPSNTPLSLRPSAPAFQPSNTPRRYETSNNWRRKDEDPKGKGKGKEREE